MVYFLLDMKFFGKLFCVLTVIVCNTFFYPLYSQTIREKADSHFALIDWIVKPVSDISDETNGNIIPGGNETFPVLGLNGRSGVPAIYPEIEGLGKIDYKNIKADLLNLMRTLSSDFKNKKIDSTLCNPLRPFIAPLTTFKLRKLPEPVEVFFSRPSVQDGDESNIIFRLKFLQENIPSFILIMVKAVKIDDAWKINEIIFEGVGYAGLAQPN